MTVIGSGLWDYFASVGRGPAHCEDRVSLFQYKCLNSPLTQDTIPVRHAFFFLT